MKKTLKQAISLVVKSEDRVLVTKRSMDKPTYPGFWSLPSTYVRDGERDEEAAYRLAREKLGLNGISTPVLLGISPIIDQEAHLLEMRDYLVPGYSGNITLNPREYTDSRWLIPSELKDLMQNEHNGVMGECVRVFLTSKGLATE